MDDFTMQALVNAGVTYLQEVKRLEKVVAAQKEVNEALAAAYERHIDAIAEVKALHKPYDTPDDPWAKRRCLGCVGSYDHVTGRLVNCAWPCPTATAMGIEGDQ
jgi:hypothetical protein